MIEPYYYRWQLRELYKTKLPKELPLWSEEQEAFLWNLSLCKKLVMVRDVYQARGDTANAQLHEQRASAIAEEMGMPNLVSSVPSIKGEQ